MRIETATDTPTPRSIQLVREARERLLRSTVSRNEWAKDYIAERDADLWRFAKDIDLLEEEVEPGAKILEHGAAPFVLTQALTQAQYSVTAGDSDPNRFGDLSELPFDVVKHDVEKDSIEENFDAVIMNELFEHLRLDLVSTLQSVLSTLKPGGYLFLSTPNAASIEGVYNLIVYNTSYSLRTTPYHEWSKLDRIGHMGHVKEYTAGEVADFLTEVGFEDERIVYRNPHQRESANSLRDYFFSMGRRMFKGLNPLFSVVARRPHVE